MNKKQKIILKDISLFHLRNKHQGNYDFNVLINCLPELKKYVFTNEYGIETINFFDPKAVKTLNKSLLKYHYNIDWDIPSNYLCPPVPGRADYIHYIADLLGSINNNQIPKGSKIKGIDIGVGANCIYPIIGSMEYGWSFLGTDIDKQAIEHASKIIDVNPSLKTKISFRIQKNKDQIFKGIINVSDKYDFSICNPPFHASAKEANDTAFRKLKNLGQNKNEILNFGGQSNELFCEGGEFGFIKRMINESKFFSENCFWFTCLVSKKENLKPLLFELKKVNVFDVKTILMKQGNKTSRFIAWTYQNESEQKVWIQNRF